MRGFGFGFGSQDLINHQNATMASMEAARIAGMRLRDATGQSAAAANPFEGLAKETIAQARRDRARADPIQAEATGNGAAVVHWAVVHHSAEDVSAVVRSGADVNATATAGQTALHTAAQLGKGKAVMALLVHGANTEATFSGATPLHLAASAGNIDGVNALLTWGAEVNVATTADRATALHFAAGDGNVDIVQSLLNKNANINAVTNDRWTPLHVAAGEGHASVVKALLKRHATTGIKNSEGKTALQVATESRNSEVVRTFQEFNSL